MKVLTQAQSGKGTKAQRNYKNINELRRHKVAKVRRFCRTPYQSIGAQRGNINSVPVCLSASVPNNKGLTLLEIAISMAILSIALVALANLFPIGLKASRRAANFSEASILAQRVINSIKTSVSIFDPADNNIFTDGDGIGYLELASQDLEPLYDLDATAVTVPAKPLHYKYNNTDMDVYITIDDWDANGNGVLNRTSDFDDVLLSQQVSVAVYWTEGDRDRADTFITYISNPFYEKYK